MQKEKQNFLDVSYDFKKGLLFKWNFKDIHQINNYFHHLFVIQTHKKSLIQAVLHAYYKKMKSGDLLGVIYCNNNKMAKKWKWIQKTQILGYETTDLLSKMTNFPLSDPDNNKLFALAQDLAKDCNQNMIINVLWSDEQQSNEQYCDKLIQVGRSKGSFMCPCTFMGSFRNNHVSFSNGVNFINIQIQQINQIMNFYNTVINSAAIKLARTVIQCTDGQILTYDPKAWKNIDFNRIQRTFFGPPVNYQEDMIHFHVMDRTDRIQFDLIIYLQIVLFSNQKYSTSKKLKLSFPSQKHYQKSVNLSMLQPYINILGVHVQNNPYNSISFAKLIRSNSVHVSTSVF